MLKVKKYLFIVVMAAILVAFWQPALALEITYPNFTGAPANGPQTGSQFNGDILVYINYFFMFLVVTAGIIAVMQIVYSGFLILLAANNPSAITDAKERILGCFMGIALLLFSFIILRTINPELVNRSTENGQYPPGVYYVGIPKYLGIGAGYNGPIQPEWTVEAVQPRENEPNILRDWYGDVEENFENDYQDWYFWYNCTPNNNPGAPPDKVTLVWTYGLPDYKVDPAQNGNNMVTKTIQLECQNSNFIVSPVGNPVDGNGVAPGNSINLTFDSGIESLKFDYQKTGVYYYLTPNCDGISSEAQQLNGAIDKFNTQNPAQDFPGSIKILNGTTEGSKYGVVLTRGNDAVGGEIGECSDPETTTACKSIQAIAGPDFKAKAAYVLRVSNLNPLPLLTLQSSSYRVKLSDRTRWPWFGNSFIHPQIGSNLNLNDLFSRGEIYRTGVHNDCTEAKSCLTSIYFSRNAYNVILYAQGSGGADKRCYTTTRSVTGFQNHPALQDGRNLYKLWVISAD